MSDPVGKYTDDDLNDDTTQTANADQREGEYTDTETVSEAAADGHTHTEHEHDVNGHVVSHTSSDNGETRDLLANDGVGDGDLDLEDRTERHD